MTLEALGLMIAFIGCCGVVVALLLPLYKKPWFLVPASFGLMLGGIITMAIGGA